MRQNLKTYVKITHKKSDEFIHNFIKYFNLAYPSCLVCLPFLQLPQSHKIERYSREWNSSHKNHLLNSRFQDFAFNKGLQGTTSRGYCSFTSLLTKVTTKWLYPCIICSCKHTKKISVKLQKEAVTIITQCLGVIFEGISL